MEREYDLYVEGIGRLAGKGTIDEILDVLVDKLNELNELGDEDSRN